MHDPDDRRHWRMPNTEGILRHFVETKRGRIEEEFYRFIRLSAETAADPPPFKTFTAGIITTSINQHQYGALYTYCMSITMRSLG
jgi:hypothetical protein